MYKVLKQTRVAVALLFLVLITAAFMHFTNSETSFFSFFLKLQFVPSLLGVFTGSAIVFITLLLLTIFFGRVYCSTICPLGVFQDVTSRTARLFKTKKQKRFFYQKPKKSRYIILGIIALFFIVGITLPLAYLDPYSIWGRISSEILTRAEHLIHNGTSFLFPDTIYFRTFAHFAVGSFIFALSLLLLVILFSAFRGRLYCNTICPVGSFLGLISKFSAFQPVINKEKCIKCQLCVIACKSQCIDLKTQIVDTSRCVACMNCVATCKNGSMTYSFTWKKSNKAIESNTVSTQSKTVLAQSNNLAEQNKSATMQGKNITMQSKSATAKDKNIESPENNIDSPDRRKMLIAMGLMGTALAAKAIKIGPIWSTKPKITGIAPPGAVSVEHLKQNCTACHACISACPNNIIKPATLEYGIDGVLLPVLSFGHHYCSYECNECSKVCPSNAIMPITLEEKKLTQVGKVRFTPKKCIVFTDGTACGACEEHCPTKAITMVPFGKEGLYLPSVKQALCIGCGGCEFICPAVPEKAMIVYASEVQGTAKKPPLEKQEKVEIDGFGF